MKRIVTLILILIAFGFSTFAQDQNKDQVKEDRKKAKAEKIERLYNSTMEMLENKQFVLEAHFLGNKYGERIPVTPNLNFIIVDSTNAVIQVGSPYGIGYNGVGGITSDGHITRWDLTKNDKKNNFYLRMNVLTNLGAYDISMSINADGYATATISGTRSGQLIYTGSIQPSETSRVYQGYTTY